MKANQLTFWQSKESSLTATRQALALTPGATREGLLAATDDDQQRQNRRYDAIQKGRQGRSHIAQFV